MLGRLPDASLRPRHYHRGLTIGRPIDRLAPVGELGADELHVWALALDGACSACEQQLAARAGLRALVGSYLGIAPREVEIRRGLRGRPELAAARELSFSLSHTAGLALFAFGRERAIGVDVEALDRRAPSAGLIERALNPREASRVMRVGAEERTGAFLAHWTVKEAYAKALGAGLALDLREVGVEGSTELPLLDLPAGAGAWHVRRLWPRPGFVGAVVADGEPWRMRLRELRLTGQAGPGSPASGRLRHPLS